MGKNYRYMTYNSWLPSHSLHAVRIFLAVSVYPVQQSHIVSVLTASHHLTTHIRHGFVECLEADDVSPTVRVNLYNYKRESLHLLITIYPTSQIFRKLKLVL